MFLTVEQTYSLEKEQQHLGELKHNFPETEINKNNYDEKRIHCPLY
jgi:hypothetical protein